MSQNYKMIIQYEGTRYDGWQKQGNTENTIQGKLEKVLERMAGFRWKCMGQAAQTRVCMQQGRWRISICRMDGSGIWR